MAKSQGKPIPTGVRKMKKKVLPKKTISDEKGDWEVTDLRRKSIMIEDEESKENSDSISESTD